MKTISRLQKEPRLLAHIHLQLIAIAEEPKTASEILLSFDPQAMSDAGYDHERRESGVLILAVLDDLVNRKLAVSAYDEARGPVYQVLS